MQSVDISPVCGKSVLVTGATGSFGNAFVRRCLADGVSRFVVYSRDELKQSQMAAALKDDRVRFFVGDVRDAERLERAMRGVDLVVHAAALKRIEVCEANPEEAIRTNVLGTLNVGKAAIDAGVERAILLSTDKAPNAATLYGATKFAAERMWSNLNVYAAGRPTRLSSVRYGNVLGSRGSVLDIFRRQILAGDDVTVTHGDATRFWLSIGQAVDLVMLALRTARGGEVIIPKAPSSRVMTLVSAVAQSVDRQCSVTTTGLRPAERMHETLIAEDEARTTYDAGSHYIVEPEVRSWETLPPLPYDRVPEDFCYRSDTCPFVLSVGGLARMVAA